MRGAHHVSSLQKLMTLAPRRLQLTSPYSRWWQIQHVSTFFALSLVGHMLILLWSHGGEEAKLEPFPELYDHIQGHSCSLNIMMLSYHEEEAERAARLQDEYDEFYGVSVRTFTTSPPTKRYCNPKFIEGVARNSRHGMREEIAQCMASHHVNQQARGWLTIQMTYSHVGTLMSTRTLTKPAQVEGVEELDECLSRTLQDIELPDVKFCTMTRIDHHFRIKL